MLVPWRRLTRASSAILGVGFSALAFTWITLPDIRPLRLENPAETAFMKIRIDEARTSGRTFRIRQRWVSYDRIAPALKEAVRVGEDGTFFQHDGMDYDELRMSVQDAWAERRFPRGASTITQQLAKNLYLSESRTPTRKFAELLLTRRLEAGLTKRRILEIYLNVIEWGDGIFGAEAAAEAYFGVSAGALSREQAALMAAAIPNPRFNNPGRPGSGLRRRQQIILGRMN